MVLIILCLLCAFAYTSKACEDEEEEEEIPSPTHSSANKVTGGRNRVHCMADFGRLTEQREDEKRLSGRDFCLEVPRTLAACTTSSHKSMT